MHAQRGKADISNFDQDFTSEKPVLSPTDKRAIDAIDQVCVHVLCVCVCVCVCMYVCVCVHVGFEISHFRSLNFAQTEFTNFTFINPNYCARNCP